MKKYFQTALALGVIFSFAAIAFAQVKPRVGGYKEISKTSAEVRAAAEYALEAQGEKDDAFYRLKAVEKAESQTVAGTNYRLCLQVIIEDEETGEEIQEFYRAIVFRNLKKEFTLKSWTESDCGKKD
jgi:hypothetical protein